MLDLATAKARYSYWLEANPPRFTEPGERFALRKLQHPLLVWQAKHESGNSVVPIDVKIEPQTRVVAITGPNTGGKTVTLKTIGLASLMAKVGIFIPAQAPVELPWFGSILADIGDEQSLQQSLSTFSGHIRRISRIIEAIKPEISPQVSEQADLESEPIESEDIQSEEFATEENETTKIESQELEFSELESESEDIKSADIKPETESIKTFTANSLVLLDEVGAGTDPVEGSTLAIALLRYLATNTL